MLHEGIRDRYVELHVIYAIFSAMVAVLVRLGATLFKIKSHQPSLLPRGAGPVARGHDAYMLQRRLCSNVGPARRAAATARASPDRIAGPLGRPIGAPYVRVVAPSACGPSWIASIAGMW